MTNFEDFQPFEMELCNVLTVLCCLMIGLPQDSARATPAQVEQAHQLLNGEWEILSITDDGETLGRELVRNKLAENGRVIVADRSFRVVNPETGEAKVTPFRVDPSKLPRQLNLTTREDRVIGGIYKFEGDNLVVCLESFPDSGHPASFDAPMGSNRMLVTLRMVPRSRITEPAILPKLDVQSRSASATTTAPVTEPTTTTVSTRRPTETEITRVRELFSGNWDITSIMDDGENLGTELIRRRFAENGQLRFGTRAFAIVNPKTEERKVSAYRIDPSQTPSHIDVTTQFDTVLKGIYVFDGDKLRICLAKREDDPRPTVFEAPGGSDRILLNLKLSKESTPAAVPVSMAKPVATEPAKPAAPSPEEEARKREATIRRLLTGSWTMNDTKGTLTSVFQPDGSFVATRTWSKSARRLFGPPSDSSNGSWSYRNGVLSAWVTSTTDARIAGHTINARVQSIGEDTFVATDAFGTVKTFRKLR